MVCLADVEDPKQAFLTQWLPPSEWLSAGLERLDDLGLTDNTLFSFIRIHGAFYPYLVSSNAPFKGAGVTLWGGWDPVSCNSPLARKDKKPIPPFPTRLWSPDLFVGVAVWSVLNANKTGYRW